MENGMHQVEQLDQKVTELGVAIHCATRFIESTAALKSDEGATLSVADSIREIRDYLINQLDLYERRLADAEQRLLLQPI